MLFRSRVVFGHVKLQGYRRNVVYRRPQGRGLSEDCLRGKRFQVLRSQVSVAVDLDGDGVGRDLPGLAAVSSV